MRTNDMFSECCDGDGEGATCGATAMFPQFTIYDSMKVDGVSFKFYMNATCGLASRGPSCHYVPLFIQTCWETAVIVCERVRIESGT